MPVSDEVLWQRCKMVISAIIGIGFLVCAIISVSSTIDFLRSSIVVQGHVVGLNFGGHHAQIEFVTQKGEHISTPKSAFTAVGAGDQVPVRYRPDAPLQTARLDVFSSIWGDAVVLSLTGLALMVGSLLKFSSAKKFSMRR
ncbi:DUF3592 domain-containing protein [Paraburkholderia sp. SIMBA_030]|uniref:DUF3592 domain-containing protein n=1 Tax=Paraburkholderia sp. SIMBA_030 TaxID=3085773 RepID=UPI003979C085